MNVPHGFYVYAYLRERDSADGDWIAQTPYYVGKGKRGRAWQTHYPIPRPKDSTNILILADRLTEEEAHALEKQAILYLGRTNIDTGCLRNFTDGGEGQSGRVISRETRERLREQFSGAKSSFYGKPAWNRGMPAFNAGKRTMPEVVEKLRRARWGLKVAGSSSPYHGVHWLKNKKRWRAYSTINGKTKMLGTSKDPVVCARLRDSYVRENGLDRPLNFPLASSQAKDSVGQERNCNLGN